MEQKKLENSAFVKAFTLAILKTINPHLFLRQNREIINADLIPSVSEKIFRRKFMQEEKRDLSNFPISNSREKLKFLVTPINLSRQKVMPQIYSMPAPANMPAGGEYGKLDLILKDPTVTLIDCSGPDKNLAVVRAGQRQIAAITLNSEEIKKFLEKVAEKAMIPLLEGVFKAAVDNFIVNAFVSGIVGSRFVIRKQTPYSLLDNY